MAFLAGSVNRCQKCRAEPQSKRRCLRSLTLPRTSASIMSGLFRHSIHSCSVMSHWEQGSASVTRSPAGRGEAIGCSLQTIRIFGIPARRDADVGQTEQALDGRPLTQVIALGEMADVLEHVAQ